MRKCKRFLAMILAIVIACMPLAACSSNGSRDAQNTLVFGQGSEPRGLDPGLVDDVESSKVIGNIYEGLVKFAKDSVAIEPCLAESWEISEGGLHYTFYLRQGVKFHDGSDFNAEAVKFNIDRFLPGQRTEDMPYAQAVYGAVKNVQVIDPYTVKINLEAACTPFLSNLAMIMTASMVSPKALQENENNVNENPVGTGPYRFVRWDKSQNVVLTRNDQYWGKKAVTQNVIFKMIADKSARVVALTNGEVDMIDGIDATVVDQIKSGGCNVWQKEGMNIFYMAYNTTKTPFDKKEVRKAVTQAVNVREMTQSLLQGYATAATSILPSFVSGYDESIKQPEYDPDAAKTALQKAGVTKIHMITHTNNGQEPAEAIQGYLSKIGVQATIDAYDWTTYKDKIKGGDYDMCFYGWTGDNGDPDNFLSLLSNSDPTINVSRYSNSNYNAAIQEGLVTPAGDRRNAIYTNLEKLQSEESVWIPLWHKDTLSGYRPNIQNYSYHVTGTVFLSEVSKK